MKGRNGGSKGLVFIGAALFAAAGIWGAVRLSSGGDAIPAETNAQRIEFIASCGFETGITHTDVTEIRIPVNFDEVYEEYNEIQLKQGFDLRPYRAHSVKKYTYLLNNYRSDGGAASLPDIYANLLVENGEIIGADISSGEAGGFVTVLLHGE